MFIVFKNKFIQQKLFMYSYKLKTRWSKKTKQKKNQEKQHVESNSLFDNSALLLAQNNEVDRGMPKGARNATNTCITNPIPQS